MSCFLKKVKLDFAVHNRVCYNIMEDVLVVVYVSIVARAFDEEFTDAGLTS